MQKSQEGFLDYDYVILPKTHPPMYMIHKYWARKPHNIVSEYIQKYSKEGDIVLDPFCGSGVTIIESILKKRKAIGIDINPFAIFLTKCTLNTVSIDNLKMIFEEIVERTREKGNQYFSIICPYCKSEAVITGIIWFNKNKDSLGEPEEEIDEIRIKCDHCKIDNHVLERTKYSYVYEQEFNKVQEINQNFEDIIKKKNIKIPNISFNYKKGMNFRQLRHYLIKNPNQDFLFTKRNLIILGILRAEIMGIINASKYNSDQKLKRDLDLENIKRLLLLTFTANLGQSSKMVWVISKRKGKNVNKKEVGSWTHHFYWNPDYFFEVNPLYGFINRFQKTLNGKLDFTRRLKENNLSKVAVADKIEIFTKEKSNYDALILNQSSDQIDIPNESIDYIFTDPPYGDSVQYYELSHLWNGWLELTENENSDKEIVINQRQGKNLDEYTLMLKKVFSECYRVLKKGRYMTVTFHNTNIKVRNKLIFAAAEAGFIINGLVFQMPPRNSLKSYLHYAKSPVGDYFLRFYKPLGPEYVIPKKEFNYDTLKPIIKEYIKTILVERGEETPAILLYNFIDEYLVKLNCFPLEDPNILNKILEELKLDRLFIYIPKYNSWQINEKEVPIQLGQTLSERVKEYLLFELSSKKENQDFLSKKTYSELYNLIYKKYNGILTPDRKMISDLIDNLKLK